MLPGRGAGAPARDPLGGHAERDTPADDRFDASQYAFFGRDTNREEFEIGGLEEEDEDDAEQLQSEAASVGSISSADDSRQRETDGAAIDALDIPGLTVSSAAFDRATPISERSEGVGSREARPGLDGAIGEGDEPAAGPVSQRVQPQPRHFLGADPSSRQDGARHLFYQVSLMPPQVVLQCDQRARPLQELAPNQRDVGPPPPNAQQTYAAADGADQSTSVHPPQVPPHFQQHGVPDGSFQRTTRHGPFWRPHRSKYMTSEDIENVVRIQWGAMQTSDPYVDDYYHQAVQNKLSAASPLESIRFSPSYLRDLSAHARPAAEPHAYLQVDALGRVPFSSIHRPRPLVEVDQGAGSGRLGGQDEGLGDGASHHKPLEQEPMLAARIAVEDGLCLLLDVDDVDRLLSISQPPDGGALLRRRRQLLLDGLAVSLQLVDSNSVFAGGRIMAGGHMKRMTQRSDLVFLRIASLTKGRKLLMRYLYLLPPGSELVLIVTMALFRHLRFLFGALDTDPVSSAVTFDLANAINFRVSNMDLPALSACLAAVVSAPEQTPLRPIGSPAGDGATVVLRVVLERATGLLMDRSKGYPMHVRAVWQAAFDAFFKLLADYCTNKYESIIHLLTMASPGNPMAIDAAAAVEMSKEIPVELFRASLPHMNDGQRRQLLEFTEKSLAKSPFPSQAGNENPTKMATFQG